MLPFSPMILSPRRHRAVCWLVAVVTASTFFLWQGHQGFSLWDEGFLWYGAQRVLRGDVPIRDFMAYDPARYYWSASFMALAGNDGIVVLRMALTAAQVFALAIALMLLPRPSARTSLPFLIVASVVLALWTFPQHKVFDILVSISLVAAAALFLQRPSERKALLLGLTVGLAAVVGRNHGVYGVIGSVGVLTFVLTDTTLVVPRLRTLRAWSGGVIGGYLPVLLMMLAIPGFSGAFLDSIRYLFEIRTTNLALPVPWPWTVPLDSVLLGDGLYDLLIGVLFVAVTGFGILGIIWVFLARTQGRSIDSSVAASAFLALPYANVALSRADINHLAQAIFPLLLGILSLAALFPTTPRWLALGLVLSGSLFVMIRHLPGYQCRTPNSCIMAEVAGDNLRVDVATSEHIRFLRDLGDTYLRDGGTVLSTPFWPGAYALLGVEAPVWEIYPLFPRSVAFEQAEIDRLEQANPDVAVIVDLALDGNEALRFRSLRPLMYTHIVATYQKIEHNGDPFIEVYRSERVAP